MAYHYLKNKEIRRKTIKMRKMTHKNLKFLFKISEQLKRKNTDQVIQESVFIDN